jgi:hypothetical protein
MSIQDPRNVNQNPRRPQPLTEVGRSHKNQRGGPIPIVDLSSEDDYIRKVELDALKSGKSLTEASDWAKRTAAAREQAYRDWKDRSEQGMV